MQANRRAAFCTSGVGAMFGRVRQAASQIELSGS
jgi:hypothetical protein